MVSNPHSTLFCLVYDTLSNLLGCEILFLRYKIEKILRALLSMFTFEVLKYLPFCIFGYIQVLALAVGLGNTSAAAEYCPTAPRC